jgi:AcrR family transcriptional regulator
MVEARQRGRPRDADIDARVLEAARELLEEAGFAGATIQAIAQRAGVQTPAVYRRWPNRIRLIEECVFPGLDEVDVRPSGNLEADLGRFVAAYDAAFARRCVRNAMPALIAAYQSDPDALGGERGYRSARPQFRAILEAAPGEAIDRTLDPDDLFDLLVGAVMYHSFVLTIGVRSDGPDRFVELLLRAMRPVDRDTSQSV